MASKNYEERLERSIRVMLIDMVKHSNGCGCCDSDSGYAGLLRQTLEHFPVELWPPESLIVENQALRILYARAIYEPIQRALKDRRITW